MGKHLNKIGLAAAVIALAVPHFTACQSGQGQQGTENTEAHTGTDASSVPGTEAAQEEAQTDSTESISAEESTAAATEVAASAVSPEISEQIAAYVANRGVWIQDDEYSEYYYALYDLDRDGMLELLTSVCQGTGFYSYSNFYRLEDGMAAVVEIPQEDWLELDIGISPPEIYRDYRNNVDYFYGSDYVKNGVTQWAFMNGYFRYDGGQITDITGIGGSESLYDVSEDVVTETYFDGDGITIDLESWKEATAEFKEDKLLTGDVFFWDRWYAGTDYGFRMSTLSNEEMQEYFENLYAQYQAYVAGRDCDAILEKLAGYPDSYEALGETDACIVARQEMERGASDEGKASGVREKSMERWQQFADAVEQGTPAQIVVADFTVEGDPVLTYLDYNGHDIYGITDSSRDGFAGDERPYEGFFFSYLKAFEETDEAGNTKQLWMLVNREAVTMEELKEGDAEESIYDTQDYRSVFTVWEYSDMEESAKDRL